MIGSGQGSQMVGEDLSSICCLKSFQEKWIYGSQAKGFT